jgi:leader peptidase (prepilin peptidase) / N-methyltransferase
MNAAIAAPLGLLIGSFLNVVAYRLPRGESLLWPASHCPGCEQPIKPYDNVPVLSWLLLRGKCRGCGEQISPRYPAIELLTAVAFGAIVVLNGVDTDLIWELPFAAMLIAVAGIDLEHRIIPNKVLLPSAVFAVATAIALRPDDLMELGIAGAAAFMAFLLAALAYPAGMGMGDVKLAMLLGAGLGASVVAAFVVGLLAGFVAAVFLLVTRGTAARKMAIPFVPFLAFGGLFALFLT